MTARCRSCSAPITWAITTHGNRMPLDPEPAAGGNVLLTGRHIPTDRGATPECRVEAGPTLFDDGTPRYMPHHATCPHADDWRRR